MRQLKIYILLVSISTIRGDDLTNSSQWQKLPEDCGKTKFDEFNYRIINGDIAQYGQFPWIARLGKTRINQNIWFNCGGAIISRYYVLSAAHCEEMGDIVRVGENNLKTDIDCDKFGECAPPHQDIKIARYIFEDYCVVSHVNDIMILELETPIEFNDYVQPICLPRNPVSYNDLLGTSITISGWGTTDISGTFPHHLIKVMMNVTSPEVCHMDTGLKLLNSQMCLGNVNGGNGVCTGDSGGPAFSSQLVNGVRRSQLLGIASYTTEPCGAGASIFAFVPYYLETLLKSIVKS